MSPTETFRTPNPSQPRGLVALFAATSFLAALLLFWIQPLYGKLVLPLYGGAPAVWTAVNLFFQAALLAGYLYAHALGRLASPRAALALHFALLALCLAWLPVQGPQGLPAGEPGHAVLQLLGLLAVHVGLPFFAVAATAPLIQKWFAGTAHPRAGDPYFLYSASNLGSMAALLGYPFVLEPLFGLAGQARGWAAGFGALVLLLAAAALAARRGRAAAAPAESAPPSAGPAPRAGERLRWVLLAAAPSSLLLGVTQHITAEIAAVPLLWVLPLALYMLSFVIAFARRPLLSLEAMARLQPPLAIALVLLWPLTAFLSVLLVHLAVFFVTATLCHSVLVRRRPAAAHLTEFYLWLALGGALGGAFNALAAPLLFDSYAEYPLAIALACLLRPAADRPRWLDFAGPAALLAALALLRASGLRPFQHGIVGVALYLEAVGIALYLLHRRPLAFALAVLAVLAMTPLLHGKERLLSRERSFFGVHSVIEDESGKFRVLMHGITVHGAQWKAPQNARRTTTYYHADSPVGRLFAVLAPRLGVRNVAVVGLGAGTLACYRRPGERWTFYEIDPVVLRYARDPAYFSFLADCAGDAEVVLGDARLSLERVPDGSLDLLVIDAFSSDAIPVHLVTREAIALYLRKLAPRGVLAMHLSNQYLDLAPVVARLAADSGVAARVPGPRFELSLEEPLAAMESQWIALARRAAELQPMVDEEGWIAPELPPRTPLWTDDYSNLAGALK